MSEPRRDPPTRSLIVWAVALALTCNACFLRTLAGNSDQYGGSSLSGTVEMGWCDFDTHIPEFWGCTYVVRDDQGLLLDITSTFRLISEFGVFGVILDPLILQVPETAHLQSGTFRIDGDLRVLDVTRTVSFDVQPDLSVTAEPGTVFLILDLPPDSQQAVVDRGPDQPTTIDFFLGFTSTPNESMRVKPMFTAHVAEEGRDYYLPLLPCVTDFAQVPHIDLPLAVTEQDLMPQIRALASQYAGLACDRKTYTLSSGPVTRHAGVDRVETAIAVSQASFASGAAATAVLARADLFPDALAGAPFARALGGPILLTPSSRLDDRTAQEIGRVAAAGSTVYLLGGEAALSAAVAEQVTELGYQPERLGGEDRFDTAAIIGEFRARPGEPVYLADGGTFQAALLAGNAAARDFGTVLLTAGPRMPERTRAFLDARPQLEVIAVGDDAVAAAPSAAPVAGTDPAALSVALAERVWGDAPTRVALASAATFPDGLTGGPHSAGVGAPLLLTTPASLSAELRDYLEGREGIVRADVYGGEVAVSRTVTDELAGLLSRDR